MAIQFLVIVEAVDGQHGSVVMSQGDKGTWRVLVDMLLVAVFIDQLALGVLA